MSLIVTSLSSSSSSLSSESSSSFFMCLELASACFLISPHASSSLKSSSIANDAVGLRCDGASAITEKRFLIERLLSLCRGRFYAWASGLCRYNESRLRSTHFTLRYSNFGRVEEYRSLY